MIERTDDISAANLAGFDAVIDVRSPAEFKEDHLPGAVNLPVLSDQERAEVGRIYVRESRFQARRLGAAFVARNVAAHLDGALADASSRYRPLVYCWRGGMRSGAMATILSQIGWRVFVLEGGYRTWRRAVTKALRESVDPLNVVLLDGQTGTAKSRLLHHLSEVGQQTLDLEKLAAHRGSVFGAVEEPQPSQRFFETMLWDAIRILDPAVSIIVEAESARIGKIALPSRLWRAMASAPRIELRAGRADRARYLVRTYATAQSRDKIVRTVTRLASFHSKATIATWRQLAEDGAFEALADALMLQHYDPLYDRSRARRGDEARLVVELDGLEEGALRQAAAFIRDRLSGADLLQGGGKYATTQGKSGVRL